MVPVKKKEIDGERDVYQEDDGNFQIKKRNGRDSALVYRCDNSVVLH